MEIENESPIERKKLEIVVKGKLQLIVETSRGCVKVINGGNLMPYKQFKQIAINKAIKYKY
ncbi:MAG: hypothetical protein ABIH76_06485 [Candidatus Bathyarchaeota archaeon]